jgi:hypothetical protein
MLDLVVVGKSTVSIDNVTDELPGAVAHWPACQYGEALFACGSRPWRILCHTIKRVRGEMELRKAK